MPLNKEDIQGQKRERERKREREEVEEEGRKENNHEIIRYGRLNMNTPERGLLYQCPQYQQHKYQL